MNDEYDIVLPETPSVKIYKETFGGIIDVTDKWNKENGE